MSILVGLLRRLGKTSMGVGQAIVRVMLWLMAYWLPYSRSERRFSRSLLDEYARIYAVRNLVAGDILIVVSSYVRQLLTGQIYLALFVPACVFGALAGFFSAAAWDNR